VPSPGPAPGPFIPAGEGAETPGTGEAPPAGTAEEPGPEVFFGGENGGAGEEEPVPGDEEFPGEGSGEMEEPGEEDGLSPEERVLEMDIKTSTLAELASWCRTVGLSEGGTRADLASRLRNYYGLAAPETEDAEGGSNGKKIITIESAKSTEYFTLETVDEEYARLRGDVMVSLKDGDAVHRIKAWEILYNRTRNLLTASGGVEYIKESGDTIETFRGERITVNLDDWSSTFLEGVSERGLSNNSTTYRFAGTVISRTDEEVTVLSKAEISNASNAEAFWSIKASKIWLLPGSDFAILNAVLKVGEIPLLYIPYFYYPADEIVFHPVLGYRSREGNFLQTTTYILGRPQADTSAESSITNILGNSTDMEKRQEGIFLRSTGKKSQDPNDTRLSLIFDLYANLGTYLGTEFVLPRKGIFGAFNLSAGIGFTRDIYNNGGAYTPFSLTDGTSSSNNSRLFSYELPFRYRFSNTGSISAKYGSLNWALPFYSDPFVDLDFLKRTEIMNWFSMLKDTEADNETNAENTYIGSYEWRLNGAFNPPVSFLSPYITSLSVSSITSTIAFRTRQSATQAAGVSPNRLFFYPDRFTLYSLNTSIAGTPFTIGGTAKKEAEPEEEKEDLLKDIGSPRSPWGEPREEAAGNSGVPGQLIPPVLTQSFELPRGGGPRFSIDYRFNPSTASELQFRSTPQNWAEVEDISWSELSSILSTVRSDGSVGFNINQNDGSAYTASVQFSGTGSWQDYTYLNDDAEEFTDSTGQPDAQKIDAARLRTYNADYFTTSYAFSTTIKPLYQSAVWGNSSVQYTFKGLLAKSIFDGTGADPSWDVEYGKWDKENLETHQVSANISATVMDKSQTVSIIADLPPEDDTLAGNATFRAWISETSFRGRIFEPYDEKLRVFEPLYFTETLRFASNKSFQQAVTYDPELEEYTNLVSTLTLGGFSASLSAVRSHSFNLEPQGWIQNTGDDDLKLNLRDLRISYVQRFTREALWNNRLSFSFNVNSSLNFDLQRYTYSRFSFTLGFTLTVKNFLDLTFSATSENAVIFRYVQNIPFFDLPVELPGEQNFLIDLWNSFRFDDEELRRGSGFKLKSFSLSLTHHLGDWNARLGITLSPYLEQNSFPYRYKFNNEISFLVQWVPIGEIKTEMNYSYDKDLGKDRLVFK
jgi:lipopolysaccharide assembly outer membrane protein LptD (OstA)